MSGAEISIKHAYLHGFASGPKAKKGLALALKFAERDLTLHRPDLNNPSFAKLTVSGMLEAMDALHEDVSARAQHPVRWRLIASSMGGWVASLWAQANPEKVDRLLLLCPGFDMAARWPFMMGADAFTAWKREGHSPFPEGGGTPVPVHWHLVEDAASFDPAPAPPPKVPVTIVHGRADAVVDPGSSRRYAKAHPQVELHEVDDDHLLRQSVDRIWELARTQHIEATNESQVDPESPVTFHWDFFGGQAEPTAKHFLKHLDEFIAREELDPETCTTGVKSERSGHHSAYCTAPARYEALIVASLRPRRKT